MIIITVMIIELICVAQNDQVSKNNELIYYMEVLKNQVEIKKNNLLISKKSILTFHAYRLFRGRYDVSHQGFGTKLPSWKSVV